MKKLLQCVGIIIAVCMSMNLHSAASSESEDHRVEYETLVEQYRKINPTFNNLANPDVQLVHFVNDTTSPVTLLLSIEGQYVTQQVAPSEASRPFIEGGRTFMRGNELTLTPANTLLPLVGIKPESMLTGSRWMPTAFTTAIGTLAYGSGYTPYDLSEIIPQGLSKSLVIFSRNGTGFKLEAMPFPEEQSFEAFTQMLAEKAGNGEIYLRNDSPYSVQITFNADEREPVAIKIGSGERIQLQNSAFKSPLVSVQSISRFGAESPAPAWLTATMYKPIQKILPALTIKGEFDAERPAISGFQEDMFKDATFDVVIPKDSWNLYFDPVRLPALFQYPEKQAPDLRFNMQNFEFPRR